MPAVEKKYRKFREINHFSIKKISHLLRSVFLIQKRGPALGVGASACGAPATGRTLAQGDTNVMAGAAASGVRMALTAQS